MMELFHMFVKVPVLWRIHIVLRIFKISFISSSFSPRPRNSADLSKWYTANVLQAIHAALWILDYIPGHIFRIEIFNPDSGQRIKLLWRIYFCATAFQVVTAAVILAINPLDEKWLACLQAAISIFNLYYCIGGQMMRLGIRFEGWRPRSAIVDAPYESIITDGSYRDQVGSSVIHDERSADDSSGPLAKALVKQQQLEALHALQIKQEEARPRLQYLMDKQEWREKIGGEFPPEELQELQELQTLFDVPGLQDQPELASLAQPLYDSELQEDNGPGEVPSQLSASKGTSPYAPNEVVDEGGSDELEAAQIETPELFISGNENDIEGELADTLLFPSRLTSHAMLSDKWTWVTYWVLAILNIGVISVGILATSYPGGVWSGKLLMSVTLACSLVSFADQGVMVIVIHNRKPLDVEDLISHERVETRVCSLFQAWRGLFWYPLACTMWCKFSIWLGVAFYWLQHPHLPGMISSETVAPKLAFVFDFLSLVIGLVLLALTKSPSP